MTTFYHQKTHEKTTKNLQCHFLGRFFHFVTITVTTHFFTFLQNFFLKSRFLPKNSWQKTGFFILMFEIFPCFGEIQLVVVKYNFRGLIEGYYFPGREMLSRRTSYGVILDLQSR
jgi:hypothetical protein